MGLFGSLKGDAPKFVGNDGNSDQGQRKEEKRRWFGRSSPGHHEDGNPSHSTLNPANAAPLNAPPSRAPPEYVKTTSGAQAGDFSNPHASQSTTENPPPYHDWTSVPDTALLPPPPALHQITSINNASKQECERAYDWCKQNPLYTPSMPPDPIYQQAQHGEILMQRPPELRGDVKQLGLREWKVKTSASCPDSILLSLLPLYFAAVDSPLVTGKRWSIYFEVKVVGLNSTSSKPCGIAIGYCASPYPSWRLPGWQRGSLGVHGDDGRRFVNDADGGVDCTRPFAVDDVVGIGMTFRAVRGSERGSQKTEAEAFFTRNGRRDAAWELNEERDEKLGTTFGLEGALDLYAGIGVFGDAEVDISFEPSTWKYRL